MKIGKSSYLICKTWSHFNRLHFKRKELVPFHWNCKSISFRNAFNWPRILPIVPHWDQAVRASNWIGNFRCLGWDTTGVLCRTPFGVGLTPRRCLNWPTCQEKLHAHLQIFLLFCNTSSVNGFLVIFLSLPFRNYRMFQCTDTHSIIWKSRIHVSFPSSCSIFINPFNNRFLDVHSCENPPSNWC